jgi:peptidyl-prolyl cis-trans isomerase SurA
MMALSSIRKPFASAVALALLLHTSGACATLIERVVAVVGERAILLSDLRSRAQPFLLQIHQGVPTGAQRNAAISQLYKGLIEKLVDEELEQRAAIQAKVTVSAREVEEALERVASQNGISVARLLSEAKKTGLDEIGYREELRRQLLQTKLINVRLQGRIRVSEDDLRGYYRRLVFEERSKLGFRVAWIQLVGRAGASRAETLALRKRAEKVAQAATRYDFAALARQHSDDRGTRENGGLLPTTKLEQTPPQLQRILVGLDVGDVSPVVAIPGGFALFKLLSREETTLPDYEEARAELSQRVYLEKMTQARRTWLDNLRRQQHVEVRL